MEFASLTLTDGKLEWIRSYPPKRSPSGDRLAFVSSPHRCSSLRALL